MINLKPIIGAVVATAMIAGFNTSASAQNYNLTLTGASPGGLWSRIGGGIDAAIAKAFPGSTVTYQTSSGGLANIPLVANGKVPLGMASDGEISAAISGQPPYKGPVKNIRALFRAYTAQARFQLTHVIVNKSFADKHGVKTFADIVNKKLPVRVAINRKGNMDSTVGAALLTELGASPDNIKSWGGQVVNAASKEMVSLMLDRRIDMYVLGIAYNHPRIRETAKGIEAVLLPIPDTAAKKVVDKLGGEVCQVKPGEYKWTPNGTSSICVGVLVIANPDLDEKTAYDVTKAMYEQIETFKEKSHRLIKKTASPDSMSTKGPIPFHPGAEKYLKEIGKL